MKVLTLGLVFYHRQGGEPRPPNSAHLQYHGPASGVSFPAPTAGHQLRPGANFKPGRPSRRVPPGVCLCSQTRPNFPPTASVKFLPPMGKPPSSTFTRVIATVGLRFANSLSICLTYCVFYAKLVCDPKLPGQEDSAVFRGRAGSSVRGFPPSGRKAAADSRSGNQPAGLGPVARQPAGGPVR